MIYGESVLFMTSINSEEMKLHFSWHLMFGTTIGHAACSLTKPHSCGNLNIIDITANWSGFFEEITQLLQKVRVFKWFSYFPVNVLQFCETENIISIMENIVKKANISRFTSPAA